MISAKSTLSWKVFIMLGTSHNFQWVGVLMAFTLPSSPRLFNTWKNYRLMLGDHMSRALCCFEQWLLPLSTDSPSLRQQQVRGRMFEKARTGKSLVKYLKPMAGVHTYIYSI